MTGAVQGWVSDDPEADWPVVSKHLSYQVDSYRKHMMEGTGRPQPRPVDPDRLRGREAGILDYFWCETPQSMASKVRAMIGDSPTETVFLWASLGGMPEEWALRHVQTICTKLAPLLNG